MFTSLKLTNFKSWKSVEVSFGRITGFFGTNSSGKSSLMQFLMLLKQTKEASDRNIALALNGPYVELGTLSDVIFQHDGHLRLDYRVDMKLDAEVVISDPSGSRTIEVMRSGELAIEAAVGLHDRVPKGEMLKYRLGEAVFSLSRNTNQRSSQFELGACGLGEFRFIRTPGRAWKLPGPMKSYQFPDQARTYFQNAGFLSDLEYGFEEQLDRLYYLGPLREDPRRDYLWGRSRPTDVGKRGENAIDAILAAQEGKMTRNLKPGARLKKFPEMVAHWLREMGLIREFRLDEVGRGSNRWQVKVRTRGKSSEVLLTDVGFGVSQVLPVITLLYYVPKGSTVVLEQPELHLHPLAQAELADLIVNVATHRDVQVILESHSEHLLLRLQRRIAEEKISSDDVNLYFCDASRGHSSIERLKLDPLGNIENWPDRFMGDAFMETAKAELARIGRSEKAAS